MGEEKKSGDGIEEKKEKESNEEEIKDSNENIIVIKVDMHCHCEACAKKISRALRAYQGVEEVAVDRKTNMVVVKGKTAEPMKICDRIRHKTGRNTHLLSPLPKPPEEQPKEEEKKVQKEEEQPKEQEPPPITTVVLGVHMHCEACAQLLRKRIRKIKGIESVETDVGKGQVIVKGVIEDPEILVMYVHKRTRKQVSLLKENEEDKKQDTNTSSEQEKKEEDQKENNNEDQILKNNTTTTVIEDAKMMMMIGDRMMNRSYDYYYPSASASTSTATSYDYTEYNHHHHDHYNVNPNYQPQIFSDENPNACFIM